MSTQFDVRVIPPSSRSSGALAQHRELWRERNDIWRVYNPTNKDYVIWFDHNPNGQNEKYVIPSKDKDIGHGKGMQDVPKYCMEYYQTQMGTLLFDELSKANWDKRRLEFREEDRMAMQEKYAMTIKNSGPVWDEIMKTLIKGVVKRWQSDLEPEELDSTQESSTALLTPGEDAIRRLGLDSVILEDSKVSDAKQDFINQIS